MARPRRLRFAALNIKLHPHDTRRYVALLRRVYTEEVIAAYHGEACAMIGNLEPEARKANQPLMGTLHRFLEFSKASRWLNRRNKKEAEAAELGLISIPDHLKPGFAEIRFFFYPERHRLVFDCTDFSPQTVRKIFLLLLNDTVIVKEFGPAMVVLEQSRETLARIWKMRRLKSLEIHIGRPNPDDFDGLEQEVEARLNDQNASDFTQILRASPGSSLAPDAQTKAYARIAVSDGYVFARGVNAEGVAVTVSTAEQPLVQARTFDPRSEDEASVRAQFASDLLAVLGNDDAS